MAIFGILLYVCNPSLMLKSLITLLMLFVCLVANSQNYMSTMEDSIYTELIDREFLESQQAIKELAQLKDAYYNDTNNVSSIYQIGVFYYRDFIRPYKKVNK